MRSTPFSSNPTSTTFIYYTLLSSLSPTVTRHDTGHDRAPLLANAQNLCPHFLNLLDILSCKMAEWNNL